MQCNTSKLCVSSTSASRIKHSTVLSIIYAASVARTLWCSHCTTTVHGPQAVSIDPINLNLLVLIKLQDSPVIRQLDRQLDRQRLKAPTCPT
jgi:hypothetical protein